MSRTDILEKVTSIVADELDTGDAPLDETTSFKDLGADSFDLLDLVTTLEDEFGLTLDDEVLDQIKTIGDAADAIAHAQGESGE